MPLSKEEIRQRQRDRYYANHERYLENKRAYYQNNKETIRAKQKQYRETNYEHILEQNRRWRKNNPIKARIKDTNYRYRKYQAMPSWLTLEHKNNISEIYTMCRTKNKETGVSHHVDHIIPIKGENVCGLHVPWNLQVVTASYNLSKKNKVEAGELTIEDAE